MELKVIAYARNGHTDKFGIPRQSRDESPIVTRIVFEPEYNVREALRGIEGFSHLWLIWGFSEVETSLTADAVRPEQSSCRTAGAVRPEQGAAGLAWSPTVRPPRLGGNKRVGVFATRSPFRPNPIGLSSVKLLGVQSTTDEGRKVLELIVSGADLLDDTPIYDIKPYLSYSDSHPDAVDGFAQATKDYVLDVQRDNVLDVQRDNVQCTKEGRQEEVPEDVMRDILYILKQDPRPGYQHNPERVYKMDYKGWRVQFRVDSKSRLYIQSIYKVD